MIRTADVKYADYIERSIYNGILAQQNPETGMVAYFLPMAAGSKKGGKLGWERSDYGFLVLRHQSKRPIRLFL